MKDGNSQSLLLCVDKLCFPTLLSCQKAQLLSSSLRSSAQNNKPPRRTKGIASSGELKPKLKLKNGALDLNNLILNETKLKYCPQSRFPTHCKILPRERAYSLATINAKILKRRSTTTLRIQFYTANQKSASTSNLRSSVREKGLLVGGRQSF